jgi:hypothetical protein
MGGVETISLSTRNRCGNAVSAVVTALAAAASAAAVTPVTPSFARRFLATAFSASAWLAALAITACVLSRPVLTRRGRFAAHGRSHGGLVVQGQILLDGIARDAFTAF